ncbi:hypothetical protein BO86DRAFT_68580 [Aspergillus japonicus CBS 114.51]|uniref:Elongation of fatty acids protein n=2 Tax=Aspergillus TaxID=5052 RepID=A0A2V5IQX8_ASPV1|nr:hypothetical protein BO86DRAFT_68580 [Aspergillus japonicus CBS 114.51]PYI22296.1 hypothetical protein BO99DRAFT_19073 [Aspergillus violaceofuscus CBS 115571]RAH82800.1 hypothetical protein BO86DRAFT_68580 [Aspergillus japonicus CBS 114.51]
MLTQRALRLTLPPSTLFKYPDALGSSHSLPFPESALSFGNYQLSPSLYTVSTDLRFATTISILYILVVICFNKINARERKPWAISPFSAWTFAAMLNTLFSAWPDKQDKLYLSRAADIVCHGGQFPEYESYASRLKLISWLFYLSKLYEPLDTVIILAKGRQASTLHIYHHAGVIFWGCVGMRFIASATIIAILFNSAVHTVMYTYYSMTALRIPVLLSTKASLTQLQIMQFFVGSILGLSSVHVEYDVPFSGSHPEQRDQPQNTPFNITAQRSKEQQSRGMKTQRCIRDSTEAYALCLGCAFVLLLMLLFLKFYVQSYLQHLRPHKRAVL